MNGSVEKFIPKDYEVLNLTVGNLNLDEYEDAILILKHEDEESDDYKRPLYILIGDSRGKFRVVAENNSSVLGVSDGGILGDPFVGVTINNGYFSLKYYGGSNWRWSRTVTFKYDRRERKWFFYQDREESYYLLKPNKKEIDIRTPEDLGTIEFERFNIFAR
jgi:hypothetical protein